MWGTEQSQGKENLQKAEKKRGLFQVKANLFCKPPLIEVSSHPLTTGRQEFLSSGIAWNKQ